MNTLFKLSALSLALASTAYATETIPTYSGDEIVVTATRFPMPADATPSNVTTLTSRDIEASGARSIPELLSHQAGIQARSIDSTPDFSLDMRGFGKSGDQNLVILLDGLRLNENEDAPAKLSVIPLNAIERIEIMRGSGAVLFGAGATGGVINIITKTAAPVAGGSLSLAAGSYGSWDGRVSLDTRSEQTSLRLSASQLDTDNYRQNNQNRQRNAMLDLRQGMGTSKAFMKIGAEDQALRLPSERVVSPSQGIDQLSTDRRGTSSPNDYSKRDSAFLSAGLSFLAGSGEMAVEVGYRKKNQEANFVRFASYLNGNSETNSMGLRYRLPYQAGQASHTLIAGADYADWDYHSLRAADPFTPAIANVSARQRNQSAYLLHLSRFTATTLSAGARFEQVDQQARDALSSQSYAQGSMTKNVRAFEVGAKHAVNSSIAVFGKIGRSYRLPVVDEIYSQWGGPSWDSIVVLLNPQRSLDREVGLDYQQGHMKVRAAAYRMEVTDELHYNVLTSQNMNLSPTLHQGFELEGSVGLGRGLSLNANYTYTDAHFVSGTYSGIDVSGKEIPLVPRHRLNLGGTWKMDDQNRLTLNLGHVGSQVYDNDQDNTFGKNMPAFTTVDTKFTHENGPWKWSLAINNLLNEKYYTYAIRSRTTAGRFNAYPMPERNFLVSGEYQF